MINAKQARELADKGIINKFRIEIDEIDKEIIKAAKDGKVTEKDVVDMLNEASDNE